MPWKKSPEALVHTFESVLPPDGIAERRQMFGFPCAFVGGTLCFGLFEDQFMVRLSETDRTALLKLKGAAPFEPMAGRPMREYVVVPSAIVAKPRELDKWVTKSIAYAVSLPPKAKKATKKATAKKTTAKTR
jgi:TfoX/Sxy family transcriptional regulator of competence genes